MLPSGHIAAGLLLGAGRRPVELSRTELMAAAVLATCLPDADLALPSVLDRLGIRHDLNTGRHHSWATHTPLFWGLAIAGARRLARHRAAPRWAPEVAGVLSAGVTIHLVQDTIANTVAVLWPLRRREYGLGLDHLPGVTDHREYLRRYPATPAGLLESALILAATPVGARAVRARRARRGAARR